MIELTFNIYSLLLFIALIIALTFGFLLLFSRRNTKKADRFLAILIITVALWNATILILDLNIHRYVIGIIWVPLNFTLALGPCFYFYIFFLTNIEFTQRPKIWPHFIPVTFEVAIFFIEVYQGIPLRLGYFQTETFKFFDPLITALALISFVIYGFFARKQIQSYHQWVKNNYSHFHRYNLNWLTRFSSVFIILFVLWLGYFVLDYFVFDYKLTYSDYLPFHLTLAVISIWLSVEAFLKPDIYYPEISNISKSSNPSNNVSDHEIIEKGQWLKNQIEQNLLYLDPELSLKSLSDILNIHPNFVSKIINTGLKQTFSDCINEFRINAVIEKMTDTLDENCTFLALAYDCGFNSKTTFNRTFKKQIGQTPKQYRDSLKKDNE